jgi:ubiquitin-like 1-activating enzyme E1 A
MRSSTILLLSLRSLAHETIKNLVLAGVGRLIVMDDGKVTEEDLGTGFLFRENDGAVGKDVRRALTLALSTTNNVPQCRGPKPPCLKSGR